MSKTLTTTHPLTPELFQQIKREAKILKRNSQKALRHKACLSIVARRYGFESWKNCFEAFKNAFKSWRDHGKDRCAAAPTDERKYAPG